MFARARYAVLAVLLAISLATLACNFGQSGGDVTDPTPRATRTPAAEAEATEETEEEPTEEIEAEPTEETEEEPTEETEAEPTEEPEEEPTEEDPGIVTGDIAVESVSAYVDAYEYYHVVGEISNQTEEAVTSIELTVAVVDGNGDTVLTDSDGAPLDETTFTTLLYTLAPGETSPFEYYVSASDLDPADWTAEVSVTDFSSAEVDRAELEVVNDQVVADEFGTIYLTGELVNLSDGPVLVNGLAGALVDAGDAVLAADASYNLTRYLAAAGDEGGNDRTPFLITLDGPVESEAVRYFWDADLVDPIETAADIVFEITNGYIDEFNRLRIAVNVSNEGSTYMNVLLVAGVYDAEGTVLDATTLSTPIYVGPGETIPVTFEYFSNINNTPDQMDLVDTYTVQIDPYWTYETSFEVVALETADEQSTTEGSAQVTFTGNVVNTSDAELSSATVVLAMYDAENNLVSSNWTGVYPDGDAIAPGDTLPFEVTVYLPPDTDTEGWTFFTFVQGYVN